MSIVRDQQLRTLAPGVTVGFRELRLSLAASRHLAALAQAQRRDGLFVWTDRPLPTGSVLALELERPSGTRTRAIAVVRWKARLPSLSGMAVDAVELTGLAPTVGAEWLGGALLEEMGLGQRRVRQVA